MRRIFCLFVWTAAAFAQPAQSDSQVLQAILTEIRQLRQDFRDSTIATQRVQIELYRVQAQALVVASATQRLDDARAKLAETQAAHRNVTVQIQQAEESQKNVADNEVRKRIEDSLVPLKSNLEALGAEVQQREARATEAEERLQGEQTKLNELQDQLDKLDKILDGLSRK